MIGDAIYGDEPYQHRHRPIGDKNADPTASVKQAIEDILAEDERRGRVTS